MSYGTPSYYSGRIRELENEKTKYVNIKDNLIKLKDKLPSIKEKLESAETNFENGGYVDSAGALDRGVLKKNYQKIETMLTELDTLISNVQGKIDGLARTISRNKQNLETAKANAANQSGA